MEDCLSKVRMVSPMASAHENNLGLQLHDIVLTASSASVHNEPSEEQKKRVEALERADKARRRQEKSHRSEVKKGRGKGGWE